MASGELLSGVFGVFIVHTLKKLGKTGVYSRWVTTCQFFHNGRASRGVEEQESKRTGEQVNEEGALRAGGVSRRVTKPDGGRGDRVGWDQRAQAHHRQPTLASPDAIEASKPNRKADREDAKKRKHESQLGPQKTECRMDR
jgi:hypothetical protein